MKTRTMFTAGRTIATPLGFLLKGVWASNDNDHAQVPPQQATHWLPPETQSLCADNACAELAILVGEENGPAANADFRRDLQRFPQGVQVNLARHRFEKGR